MTIRAPLSLRTQLAHITSLDSQIYKFVVSKRKAPGTAIDLSAIVNEFSKHVMQWDRIEIPTSQTLNNRDTDIASRKPRQGSFFPYRVMDY